MSLRFQLGLGVALLAGLAHAAPIAEVTPGVTLTFPRDAGSHPDYRTEWWYVTGWIDDARGVSRGFQVTFFRSRNESADANPSNFAPKQLLFAHAALSDPNIGALLLDERSAREGFGLAAASEHGTDVHIDDWSLRATARGYRAQIGSSQFSFAFDFTATQPRLLEGDRGYSRKGPDPRSASYYVSEPQLAVSGTLREAGAQRAVSGTAWLDHEWSSAYLDPEAVGWDWLGVNLADGAALMAFRIRDREGATHWAGGTLREQGVTTVFAPEQIEWQPRETWRSPRTGVQYPIAWKVRLGTRTLVVRPLMANQESDTRASTGTLYWEGAVSVFDERDRRIGRGYLELTGYGSRLEL